MCKLFIAVALLAAIYAHPAPNPSEAKDKLVEAGLSPEAAAGIIAIGEKYKTQLEATKGDQDAAKKVSDEIKTETDAYIKTQSEADQAAYAAFIEKVKAVWEAFKSATNSQ